MFEQISIAFKLTKPQYDPNRYELKSKLTKNGRIRGMFAIGTDQESGIVRWSNNSSVVEMQKGGETEVGLQRWIHPDGSISIKVAESNFKMIATLEYDSLGKLVDRTK